MNPTNLYRAMVLTLGWLASQAGHETGDYLVQRDCDAQRKQDRTAEGRRALAAHVVTYGITQAVVKAATFRTAGVQVPWRAVAAGQLVEMVLHAVIDDGRLLRWFAATAGKSAFHGLDAGGVNGRMLLDQATHRGLQVPAGALVTALLARRGGAR